MAIVINGAGSIAGLSVGGLPDDSVDAGSLANSINTEITANTAKTGITSSQATAIGAALPKAGGTMTGNLLVNNGSSAKLGIGTSPSHMLHVLAPASIGDYAVKIDTPDRYGLRIEADGAAAATPLVVLNGSTEIFKVVGDGRAVSQFTANAWVSFNAQGSAAIKDSHNVSSLSDNAVGWFYVNIDVNLANANAAAVGSGSNSNNTYRILIATAVQVVGSWYVMCSGHSTSTSVAAFDPELVYSIVFGD